MKPRTVAANGHTTIKCPDCTLNFGTRRAFDEHIPCPGQTDDVTLIETEPGNESERSHRDHNIKTEASNLERELSRGKCQYDMKLMGDNYSQSAVSVSDEEEDCFPSKPDLSDGEKETKNVKETPAVPPVASTSELGGRNSESPTLPNQRGRGKGNGRERGKRAASRGVTSNRSRVRTREQSYKGFFAGCNFQIPIPILPKPQNDNMTGNNWIGNRVDTASLSLPRCTEYSEVPHPVSGPKQSFNVTSNTTHEGQNYVPILTPISFTPIQNASSTFPLTLNVLPQLHVPTNYLHSQRQPLNVPSLTYTFPHNNLQMSQSNFYPITVQQFPIINPGPIHMHPNQMAASSRGLPAPSACPTPSGILQKVVVGNQILDILMPLGTSTGSATTPTCGGILLGAHSAGIDTPPIPLESATKCTSVFNAPFTSPRKYTPSGSGPAGSTPPVPQVCENNKEESTSSANGSPNKLALHTARTTEISHFTSTSQTRSTNVGMESPKSPCTDGHQLNSTRASESQFDMSQPSIATNPGSAALTRLSHAGQRGQGGTTLTVFSPQFASVNSSVCLQSLFVNQKQIAQVSSSGAKGSRPFPSPTTVMASSQVTIPTTGINGLFNFPLFNASSGVVDVAQARSPASLHPGGTIQQNVNPDCSIGCPSKQGKSCMDSTEEPGGNVSVNAKTDNISANGQLPGADNPNKSEKRIAVVSGCQRHPKTNSKSHETVEESLNLSKELGAQTTRDHEIHHDIARPLQGAGTENADLEIIEVDESASIPLKKTLQKERAPHHSINRRTKLSKFSTKTKKRAQNHDYNVKPLSSNIILDLMTSCNSSTCTESKTENTKSQTYLSETVSFTQTPTKNVISSSQSNDFASNPLNLSTIDLVGCNSPSYVASTKKDIDFPTCIASTKDIDFPTCNASTAEAIDSPTFIASTAQAIIGPTSSIETVSFTPSEIRTVISSSAVTMSTVTPVGIDAPLHLNNSTALHVGVKQKAVDDISMALKDSLTLGSNKETSNSMINSHNVFTDVPNQANSDTESFNVKEQNTARTNNTELVFRKSKEQETSDSFSKSDSGYHGFSPSPFTTILDKLSSVDGEVRFLGPFSKDVLNNLIAYPSELQKYVSLTVGESVRPGPIAIAVPVSNGRNGSKLTTSQVLPTLSTILSQKFGSENQPRIFSTFPFPSTLPTTTSKLGSENRSNTVSTFSLPSTVSTTLSQLVSRYQPQISSTYSFPSKPGELSFADYARTQLNQPNATSPGHLLSLSRLTNESLSGLEMPQRKLSSVSTSKPAMPTKSEGENQHSATEKAAVLSLEDTPLSESPTTQAVHQQNSTVACRVHAEPDQNRETKTRVSTTMDLNKPIKFSVQDTSETSVPPISKHHFSETKTYFQEQKNRQIALFQQNLTNISNEQRRRAEKTNSEDPEEDNFLSDGRSVPMEDGLSSSPRPVEQKAYGNPLSVERPKICLTFSEKHVASFEKFTFNGDQILFKDALRPCSVSVNRLNVTPKTSVNTLLYDVGCKDKAFMLNTTNASVPFSFHDSNYSPAVNDVKSDAVEGYVENLVASERQTKENFHGPPEKKGRKRDRKPKTNQCPTANDVNSEGVIVDNHEKMLVTLDQDVQMRETLPTSLVKKGLKRGRKPKNSQCSSVSDVTPEAATVENHENVSNQDVQMREILPTSLMKKGLKRGRKPNTSQCPAVNGENSEALFVDNDEQVLATSDKNVQMGESVPSSPVKKGRKKGYEPKKSQCPTANYVNSEGVIVENHEQVLENYQDLQMRETLPSLPVKKGRGRGRKPKKTVCPTVNDINSEGGIVDDHEKVLETSDKNVQMGATLPSLPKKGRKPKKSQCPTVNDVSPEAVIVENHENVSNQDVQRKENLSISPVKKCRKIDHEPEKSQCPTANDVTHESETAIVENHELVSDTFDQDVQMRETLSSSPLKKGQKIGHKPNTSQCPAVNGINSEALFVDNDEQVLATSDKNVQMGKSVPSSPVKKGRKKGYEPKKSQCPTANYVNSEGVIVENHEQVLDNYQDLQMRETLPSLPVKKGRGRGRKPKKTVCPTVNDVNSEGVIVDDHEKVLETSDKNVQMGETLPSLPKKKGLKRGRKPKKSQCPTGNDVIPEAVIVDNDEQILTTSDKDIQMGETLPSSPPKKGRKPKKMQCSSVKDVNSESVIVDNYEKLLVTSDQDVHMVETLPSSPQKKGLKRGRKPKQIQYPSVNDLNSERIIVQNPEKVSATSDRDVQMGETLPSSPKKKGTKSGRKPGQPKNSGTGAPSGYRNKNKSETEDGDGDAEANSSLPCETAVYQPNLFADVPKKKKKKKLSGARDGSKRTNKKTSINYAELEENSTEEFTENSLKFKEFTEAKLDLDLGTYLPTDNSENGCENLVYLDIVEDQDIIKKEGGESSSIPENEESTHGEQLSKLSPPDLDYLCDPNCTYPETIEQKSLMQDSIAKLQELLYLVVQEETVQDIKICYSSESESDVLPEELDSSRISQGERQKAIRRHHKEVTTFLVKHTEKFTLLEDTEEYCCNICPKYKTKGIFKLSSHLKMHMADSL